MPREEKLLYAQRVYERGRVCQQVEHVQLRLPHWIWRQELRTRYVNIKLRVKSRDTFFIPINIGLVIFIDISGNMFFRVSAFLAL